MKLDIWLWANRLLKQASSPSSSLRVLNAAWLVRNHLHMQPWRVGHSEKSIWRGTAWFPAQSYFGVCSCAPGTTHAWTWATKHSWCPGGISPCVRVTGNGLLWRTLQWGKIPTGAFLEKDVKITSLLWTIPSPIYFKRILKELQARVEKNPGILTWILLFHLFHLHLSFPPPFSQLSLPSPPLFFLRLFLLGKDVKSVAETE